MRSPFTARLCEILGENLDSSDAVGATVLGWEGDPDADALALRLVGGLHALVLSAKTPHLVAAYPEGPN